MSKYPQFSLALSLGNNNEERIEAFEFYKKAFNAKKLSESYPPDGPDIHIMMEINGFGILLAPSKKESPNNLVTCQLKFETENDLRDTYEVLIQKSSEHWIGSYPWAKVGAFVKDKYGIDWWLSI